MRPAALILFLATALSAPAADLASIRIGDADYVSLEEGASRIGLRTTRSLPESTVMLKSGAQPVARLADRSREIDLAGLRVFMGRPVVLRGGVFYISREDYDFRLVPRVRPDLCGPPPRVPHVVALDAGHGGEDHGSENPTLGTMEKTYTLDVARRLRHLLEEAGYKVVMTRDSDVNVPKQVRSEIANLANADVFVSIHFNSLWPNRKTTGLEVLSFPPKTQRSTDSWSPGHRDDSEPGDAPVNSFNSWNTVLAGCVHKQLLAALHDGDRGEKFEHLGVLRQLKCPGVLVEPAFISSDAEAAALATADFRERIAGAILSGLNDYAASVRAQHPAAVASPGPASPPQGAAPTGGVASPRVQPTRPSGP